MIPSESAEDRRCTFERPDCQSIVLKRWKHSSCALCRSRKIRCDRGNPCNNCLKSRNGTCVYVNQPSQLQQQQLSPVKVHQWPTPASSIGRESTVPSQSTLETSSTSASPLAIQPIARNMESMECRIRRLEEELSKTPQRSAQSHVPTSDADIETTRTKLAETCTIYKTRMYGQSHSMNGVRLVSLRYPINLDLHIIDLTTTSSKIFLRE